MSIGTIMQNQSMETKQNLATQIGTAPQYTSNLNIFLQTILGDAETRFDESNYEVDKTAVNREK